MYYTSFSVNSKYIIQTYSLSALFSFEYNVQIRFDNFFQIELRIERLQFGMLFEEELELCDRALQERLAEKKACKLLSATRVTEAKRALDAVQSRYETMLAEDKILDKNFKWVN